MRKLVWSGLAAALLAAAVLLRAPAFVEAPLDRDEGAYAFIAQQWSRGAVPYRDYLDHKPPLVYAAYRLAFAGGGESLVAVRAAWAVFAALTALGCAACVWRLTSSRLAAVLGGAVACGFISAPAVQGDTANTETLMACATAWAGFFAVGVGGRGRAAFAAGLCGGLAVLAKWSAVPEVGFIGLWLAWDVRRRFAPGAAERRPPKSAPPPSLATAVVFGAGVLLPALGWLVYAAARGALGAMIDAVLLYNLRYALEAPVPLWARLAALPIEYGVPFALLWVGLAGCMLTLLRREPRCANFALGWTAAAMLGTILGGRLYEHYYQQLVAPLAVAFGVTTAALVPRLGSMSARLAAAVLVLVGLALPYTVDRADAEAWQPRLAAMLRQVVPAGRSVFVWGAAPYLYFASERLPPSRVLFKYALLGDGPAARGAREELLAAVASRPPAMIVVVESEATAESSAMMPPEIERLIEGRPLLADEREFRLYGEQQR